MKLAIATLISAFAFMGTANAQAYRLCAGEIAGLNGCGQFGRYAGFYKLRKGEPHIGDAAMASDWCERNNLSYASHKKTLIRGGGCCGYKIVYAYCR